MRGKLNSTKFFKDQLKSFKKLETNKETNKVEKKMFHVEIHLIC